MNKTLWFALATLLAILLAVGCSSGGGSSGGHHKATDDDAADDDDDDDNDAVDDDDDNDDNDDFVWTPMLSGTKADLTSVMGSSGHNVYVAADDGEVLHYDGSHWSQDYKASQPLYGLWVDSSTGNLWAIGSDGSIYKKTGATWASVDYSGTNYLMGVTGLAGTTDVYIAGSDGLVLKWNPQSSQFDTVATNTTASLDAIYEMTDGSVTAAGENGYYGGYDGHGGTWAPIAGFPTVTKDLRGLWAPDASDACAVGDNATIVWYDDPNTQWRQLTAPTNNHLEGVWGTDGSDLYIVGNDGTIYFWDGSSFSQMFAATYNHLTSVWGASLDDVFAVGVSGTIVHYGAPPDDDDDDDDDLALGWSTTEIGQNIYLYGVWASSSSDVWVVGSTNANVGVIEHWNGVVWTAVDIAGTPALNAVWGASASNIIAVGQDGAILRYNGHQWSVMVSGTGSSLESVWGSSATDVWAVGEHIYHYAGSSWHDEGTGGIGDEISFNAVWGASPTNVYFAGADGTTGDAMVLQYNGTHYTMMSTPWANAEIQALWGANANNVFAVGSGPNSSLIAYFNGGSWVETYPGALTGELPDWLWGVWGSSATNVYAVGKYGEIFRDTNGWIWSAVYVAPYGRYLRAIWGMSPTDIWAVGDNGTIAHYGLGDDDDDSSSGACCDSYNYCTYANQSDCADVVSGTWFPADSCAEFYCGTRTGACCIHAGDCADNYTKTQCDSVGGADWHGDNACAFISC